MLQAMLNKRLYSKALGLKVMSVFLDQANRLGCKDTYISVFASQHTVHSGGVSKVLLSAGVKIFSGLRMGYFVHACSGLKSKWLKTPTSKSLQRPDHSTHRVCRVKFSPKTPAL